MSVADTLSDAVSELDDYLREGSGEAWPGQSYHETLCDVRDRMERLRCKIDAASMGVEGDGAASFRDRP
jgi:hypothetical protein